MQFSRREFLDFAARASVAGTLGLMACNPNDKSQLMSLVPFLNEGDAPLDEITGEGLGGRLTYDLTRLKPEGLIIPNDEFYIRTRMPDRLKISDQWEIVVAGLVKESKKISIDWLRKKARSQGVHLLECSGNSAYRSFGLISAAKWSGVSIGAVLEQVEVDSSASHVLISGFDDHSTEFKGSEKGASWIFPLQELLDAGAFLAIDMNGEELPIDHGQPVRLLVPNWYGCSCIKWVNEIRFLDDSSFATSQMREFAGRTHQDRVYESARDYQPASIDLAAMPVRVEKRLIGGKLNYRIIGIKWGEGQRNEDVEMHLNPGGPIIPVDEYLGSNAGWSMWKCDWQPKRIGQYEIQLRATNEQVRTRRLDNGYYTRSIQVDEV